MRTRLFSWQQKPSQRPENGIYLLHDLGISCFDLAFRSLSRLSESASVSIDEIQWNQIPFSFSLSIHLSCTTSSTPSTAATSIPASTSAAFFCTPMTVTLTLPFLPPLDPVLLLDQACIDVDETCETFVYLPFLPPLIHTWL